MPFKDYFKGLGAEGQNDLAARCKTSAGYLKLVAYGHKTIGEGLAVEVERETGGAIRCEDLRPDVDWEYIRSTKPRGRAA